MQLFSQPLLFSSFFLEALFLFLMGLIDPSAATRATFTFPS